MKKTARALLDSLCEVFASSGRCPKCEGPGKYLGNRDDTEIFECRDCESEFTEEEAAKAAEKRAKKEEKEE